MVRCIAALLFASFALGEPPLAQSVPTGNPFTYLDEYSDSYYPHIDFPKLTTPQWVGTPGVEAVVTLGIDDMRDSAKYEAYIRPILDRLKQIDGRAALSIMSCKADPDDPQLQSWLAEGVSIETHTTDHPCPCLQGSDFAKAKATYDSCVDTMFAIPNNQPVAFRFPCMDSKNTPSPRAFAEIVNQTTSKGNFLQASTSVVCVLNSSDPKLPKSLTLNEDGSERFERYIPFPSFVNKIQNYPYPYVIGRRCWEFPCMIPDDWQAQNIQRPANPRTVDDMLAAIDATVIKQGVANIVFHPYEWIRNDQMAALVDRVDKSHGKKVMFLTFKECVDRINKNLLLGQSIRAEDGGDNGVRLLDLNQDGHMDVFIGNENLRVARIWQPKSNSFKELSHDVYLTKESEKGRVEQGVRFGQGPAGQSMIFVNNPESQALYYFSGETLRKAVLPEELSSVYTMVDETDQGVRLRDVTGDGVAEILIGNSQRQVILHADQDGTWVPLGPLPYAIVDDSGQDNGLRFVDFDGDRRDDLVISNGRQSAICLYDVQQQCFADPVNGGADIPWIVRDGTNNGVWFAANHLWVQNEDTHRMPDGVDRRSFAELLGKTQPNPRSPETSLDSIQVRPGFEVQLVAAEPLVMDPVAIDFGPDGKLWVVEMADYPLGLDDRGQPGGRVRYLTDTDGDGVYDQSTLFLDGIAFPTGVIAWGDGVIVSAAPAVFFAADRDGDGKAEVRQELYRGFAQGNQQHLVNGFERGLDNWLYLANGDSGGVVKSIQTGKEVDIRGQDLRIRPRDGSLDAQAGRTQFGRHRDDHGNWFGSSNPLPLRHYVLADHYLRRNKNVSPPSAKNDIARVDNTQVFPISRVLSHWSGYKPPAPGSGHKFTSACSTMVYRDNLLGDDFANSTFTCEPVHNAVHRRRLIPDGYTFRSERSAEEGDREFLASTDSWFRPATVTTGPDGAIWVVDMYRLVIEHPEWIDDERETELFLRAGHDRGRIYRVYRSDTEPRRIPRLSEANTDELIVYLGSPNGRTRDLAQSLLIEQNNRGIAERLLRDMIDSNDPMFVLHALCVLDGLDAIGLPALEAALRKDHPTVRRHAIRLSEPILAKDNEEAKRLMAVLSKCKLDDAQVRLQMACSLGYSKSPSATDTLVSIAAEYAEDAYLRGAVVSSLNEARLEAFFTALNQHDAAFAHFQSELLQMAARLDKTELVASVVDRLVDAALAAETTTEAFSRLANVVTEVRRQNIRLPQATQKKMRQFASETWPTISDSQADPGDRAAAIKVAGPLKVEDSDARADLVAVLSPLEPPIVQLASAEVLIPVAHRDVLTSLRQSSPGVRSKVLDRFLGHKNYAVLLLNGVSEGFLSKDELGFQTRQRLENHGSESVRQLAKELLKDSQTSDTATSVKRYLDAAQQAGDVDRGLAVFKNQCAVCHRVNKIGSDVGPKLAAIKNRSTQAMLTAILDPNAAVEEKFRSYNLLTVDGTVHTGFIAAETSTSLTLQMQQGRQVTVLRDEIEEIAATGKSLMPEGLERVISPEAMTDLLAFLATIK